jgi:hypothetical protein
MTTRTRQSTKEAKKVEAQVKEAKAQGCHSAHAPVTRRRGCHPETSAEAAISYRILTKKRMVPPPTTAEGITTGEWGLHFGANLRRALFPSPANYVGYLTPERN